MTYYRYRFSFGSGLTPVIKNLMIAMGVVFLFQMIAGHELKGIFGLIPVLVWKKLYLWQLFSYIFLHGDPSHIFFNLFTLWMFGGELENYWGARKFLFYFFFCGVGAGIFTALFPSYGYVLVIGASGAIYGILLAFGWLFPNRPIMLLFLPIPFPAKYTVVVFGLFGLLFSRSESGVGIAHLTHLGGVISGLIYMAYPVIRQRIRREYYKRKWSQKGPGDKGYYH